MISRSEVKYIQSLAHKKFRESEGCFIAEGVKIVSELIDTSPDLPVKIFAVHHWLDQNAKNLPKHIICQEVSDEELERISFLTTPQQVLCLSTLPVIQKKVTSPITVLLDQIQDPGNLGTIIRTCDWFGIDSVVCSLDTADAFAPKVVQASMGSVLRVNVQYLNLDTFLDNHPNSKVYVATLDGEDVRRLNDQSPSFLVIGNESKGVSSFLLKRATKKISIPRVGQAESLNAAVATGILLSRMVH